MYSGKIAVPPGGGGIRKSFKITLKIGFNKSNNGNNHYVIDRHFQQISVQEWKYISTYRVILK
jgi:hypothetical protein